MAYKYHCTYCGKELDRTNVLFDMQDLLLESQEKRFENLKFRLKQEELEKMFTQPGENGYSVVRLTFGDAMSIIANANNLNNAEIAQLTAEELSKYIEEETKKLVQKPKKKNTLGGLGSWANTDNAVVTPQETQNEEYKEPKAITAIKESVTTAKGEELLAQELKEELQMLLSAFKQDGENESSREIPLRGIYEQDDNGASVLVGCTLIHPVSKIQANSMTRVCPDCGTDIGEYAFLAEHNSVVFIGSPAAGKTSTILALTHYAKEYVSTGLSTLWNGRKRPKGVEEIKLVTPSKELSRDLGAYANGLAPYRTQKDARDKSYSSTFWIRNQNGKHALLTLIDLPGELFEGLSKGNQNAIDLMNRYSVSLSCHAYIVCFDAAAAAEASKKEQQAATKNVPVAGLNQASRTMGDIVRESSEQANVIQTLRMQRNGTETFVPMMVLYTKCKDLEEPADRKEEETRYRPLEAVYRFRKEKDVIEGNGIYAAVCNQFRTNEDLSKAYHAMLRCSPYGYSAPSIRDYELVNAGNLSEDDEETAKLKKIVNTRRTPTPHHIDDLMLWILNITGSIPTEAEYAPMMTSDENKVSLNNYYIHRIQYRTQHPGTAADELQEAVARCALFENPSDTDKRVLESHGQGWQAQVMRKSEDLMRKVKELIGSWTGPRKHQ